MASFYKREKSPYYWLRLRLGDGSWKSESSGIRVEATGSLRKIQQRVTEEAAKEKRQGGDGSQAMMRNWVPRWIKEHYTNEKSAARAANAWAHLAMYFKKRGIQHPEEVSYAECHHYMKWRTDAKGAKEENRRVANWNTALTETRILCTAMQEAIMQGWILANPASRLGLGCKNVKEKRAIERDEQKLIEAALADEDGWMQDSWLVGIKQGCRISEVEVPLELINLQTKVIPFRVKGGKIHPAPLHPDLVTMVKRRRAEGAMLLVELPGNASHLWIKFFKGLGLENLSFHSLRVTVITRFAQADVTAEKAMQYVGHCSQMAHAIYRKLKPRDVAALGDFL